MDTLEYKDIAAIEGMERQLFLHMGYTLAPALGRNEQDWMMPAVLLHAASCLTKTLKVSGEQRQEALTRFLEYVRQISGGMDIPLTMKGVLHD